MIAPYLTTEPFPQSEAEAEALPQLHTVYRALVGAKPSLTTAAILLDGLPVQGAVNLEDDFADLLARVGQAIEACGGRLPA